MLSCCFACLFACLPGLAAGPCLSSSRLSNKLPNTWLFVSWNTFSHGQTKALFLDLCLQQASERNSIRICAVLNVASSCCLVKAAIHEGHLSASIFRIIKQMDVIRTLKRLAQASQSPAVQHFPANLAIVVRQRSVDTQHLCQSLLFVLGLTSVPIVICCVCPCTNA